MALTAFPMESNYVGSDQYGNPIFDRAVGSVFYRTFWSKYFTDGIFYEPSDNFKISPAGDMKVRVKLGECHIQGVTATPDDETELILELDKAGDAADRTDRIVIRADFESGRNVYVAVLKDWKASDSLTRNANIWELAIADVLVRAGTSSVAAVNISDLRLNTELCGVVTEPVKRTNTQTFFNELSAEMAKIKSDWNTQQASQQTGWTEQMDEQESDFREWESVFEAWYAGAQADIVKLQNFDFDNTAYLAGCKREVVFGENCVTETLSIASSGELVAKRESSFDGDVITTLCTVYDKGGEDKLWETQNVCVFNGNTITETITQTAG